MVDYSRREFLKEVVGAGIVLAAPTDILAASMVKGDGKKVGQFDAKSLPTVPFGSTGVCIPRMVLGLGSRYCHLESDDEAHEMLHYALDHGLFYWDTAHVYNNSIAAPPGKKKGLRDINSEERIGPVVTQRRNEIFLSTKVSERDPSKAMAQIELSLKRLQTDHLEMLKIHSVESMEDVEDMSKKGHLIDLLQRLKEEGVTKYIGFSGHSSAEALSEMTRRAPFDSLLLAMNHWRPNEKQERQEVALPAGKEKKMGVLIMKAVRPKELLPGLSIPELVRYALSLNGPDAVVIGMDSMEVLKSNLQLLNHFKALSPDRMQELTLELQPYYRHESLPWMQPGYVDGLWG